MDASVQSLPHLQSLQHLSDHFALFGAVAVVVAIVLTVVLFVPVLRKAGFSGWWIVPFMVPIVGVVLLWIFAFVRWPFDKQQSA